MNMLKKIIATLIIVISIIGSATCVAYAHPGRTDSAGGHHDYNNVSGLGSYHYHHGYPAHLHENGVCPYAFDDQANHSSSGGTIVTDTTIKDTTTQKTTQDTSNKYKSVINIGKKDSTGEDNKDSNNADNIDNKKPQPSNPTEELKAEENKTDTSSSKENSNSGLWVLIIIVIFGAFLPVSFMLEAVAEKLHWPLHDAKKAVQKAFYKAGLSSRQPEDKEAKQLSAANWKDNILKNGQDNNVDPLNISSLIGAYIDDVLSGLTENDEYMINCYKHKSRRRRLMGAEVIIPVPYISLGDFNKTNTEVRLKIDSDGRKIKECLYMTQVSKHQLKAKMITDFGLEVSYHFNCRLRAERGCPEDALYLYEKDKQYFSLSDMDRKYLALWLSEDTETQIGLIVRPSQNYQENVAEIILDIKERDFRLPEYLNLSSSARIYDEYCSVPVYF